MQALPFWLWNCEYRSCSSLSPLFQYVLSCNANTHLASLRPQVLPECVHPEPCQHPILLERFRLARDHRSQPTPLCSWSSQWHDPNSESQHRLPGVVSGLRCFIVGHLLPSSPLCIELCGNTCQSLTAVEPLCNPHPLRLRTCGHDYHAFSRVCLYQSSSSVILAHVDASSHAGVASSHTQKSYVHAVIYSQFMPFHFHPTGCRSIRWHVFTVGAVLRH